MKTASRYLLAAALALLWSCSAEEPAPAGPTAPLHPADTPKTSAGAEPAPRAFELGTAIPRSPTNSATGVAGRVIDPDGKPIEGAEVILLRLQSPWPEQRADEVAHVFTGTGGEFRFAAAPDEDLALEVIHPGMARERVAAPKALALVTVRLSHGFEVRGVASALGRGELIAHGAQVLLEPGTWGTRRAVVTSVDRNGAFSFQNVPAGTARLTVRVAAFAPTTVGSVNVGAEPVNINVEQVGYGLHGEVRSAADGEPIAGAEVRLYPSTAWNKLLYEPYRTKTADGESKGSFRIGGLASGPAFLVASHPDYTAASRPITVADGQPLQVIELGRRSALRVTFRGTTLPGMELRLACDSGELHRARLGESNVVAFPGLVGSGPATLEVIDGVRAFAKSSSRSVDVAIDEAAETGLEFEMVVPSTVVGRVVDDSGAPLAGVLVSTPRHRLQPRNPESWYAVTGTDGSFTLRGLPVGSVPLRVDEEGWAAAEVTATVAGADSRVELGDVRLARPGTIRGVIRLGGKPLAGANLFATREGETANHAVSGPDGGYALYGLAPGRYRVMARSRSSPIEVHAALVGAESGNETTGIDFDLPPGRRIRGQVTGKGGVPVPDATICLVGATAAITSTDQTGRFDIEVPEGEVELQAFAPDFRSSTSDVLGPTGRTITLRLPFVAQGAIDGSVTALLRGRLPQRVIVGITPLDLRDDDEPIVRRLRAKRVAIDLAAKGGLKAEQIPAGRVRLEILAPGLGPWRNEVEVPANGRLQLGSVRLESGAEVRGLVQDAAGQPIAGAIVHLGEAEDLAFDLAQQNLTDAEGRFVVSGVTPLGRRLVVAAAGYMTAVNDLVLPDDLLRNGPFPVVLQRSSTLHVQLVRKGEAAPVFRVLAIHRDGEFIGTRATDVDGSLSMIADMPGRYRIALFGEGEDGDRGVELVVGAETSKARVELKID